MSAARGTAVGSLIESRRLSGRGNDRFLCTATIKQLIGFAFDPEQRSGERLLFRPNPDRHLRADLLPNKLHVLV
jgi:hypothetical protein